jgi:hypothetical protein
LFEIPGLIDYQAVLTRRAGKEHLGLTVEMPAQDTEILPEIYRKLLSVKPIARSVSGGRMIEPTIDYGALKFAGRPKKRLVDNRITQTSA